MIRRYLFDVTDPTSSTDTEPSKDADEAPSRATTRLEYEDDYNPRGKPNVLAKSPAHVPKTRQVFTDRPAYSSRMHGYLHETIKESSRVVSIANEILAQLHAKKASGAFMVGVLEVLDGNIRVANSGSRSGHLDEIIKDLQAVAEKVSQAKEREADVDTNPDADPLSQEERSTLALPEWVLGDKAPDSADAENRKGYQRAPEVKFEPFERYLKQNPGILKEHVNCAAPRLLWSAMTDGPGLLGASMTEVWWDPRGENPVMIDGIRYHHMQRVPSCDRCVQNLRVVVNGALRDQLIQELHKMGSEAEEATANAKPTAREKKGTSAAANRNRYLAALAPIAKAVLEVDDLARNSLDDAKAEEIMSPVRSELRSAVTALHILKPTETNNSSEAARALQRERADARMTYLKQTWRKILSEAISQLSAERHRQSVQIGTPRTGSHTAAPSPAHDQGAARRLDQAIQRLREAIATLPK